MGFNLFKRAPKPKPDIPRIEVSKYGEPKYIFTHVPSLAVYREYNDTVSAPAIERDKKLKKIFGLVMGIITVAFALLSVKYFDLPEYLEKGRTFFEWISYTGFMFYFLTTLMAGYLTFHLLTYYKFFPKRLAKATEEYYNSSSYLTSEIILACYEEGVLEKAAPRDEFFEWGMFNRCWESENVVYLEFTLANQLFVAKEVMLEAGADIKEFMAWANEKIEIGKVILAEKEAAKEAEREEAKKELERIEEEIEELEEELKKADEADDEDREDEIEKRLIALQEKAEELEDFIDED